MEKIRSADFKLFFVDYVSCLFKLTFNHNCTTGSTRWRSLKVAGSIFDGVIDIFH
jgi:hypothetical protein